MTIIGHANIVPRPSDWRSAPATVAPAKARSLKSAFDQSHCS
jgi:hypothetical protein